MRIEEEYIRTGYFWLPERNEHKIPGILTIKDGGDIELEVVGHFDENIINTINGDDDLSRIIGYVEKDGLVTLDNCFYSEKNISFGGISKSKIYVNKVLSGVAYDKHEEVTFNSLSFSVDCMDEWVGISGINIENDFDNRTATIRYNPPENITYSLDNDMQLEICFAYTLPVFPNTTEAKITQRAYFKLKSETLRPLSDFIEIAYKLNNLLCFAIDSTVTLRNVSATSVEIQREMGKGKFYPVTVNIYYRSITYSKDVPNKSWHQMLFSYGVIKTNAQNVFNNWINAYEILSPTLNLYFSTKVGAQKYLDGKFLALAQGLETYHRRTSKEKLMDSSEFDSLVSTIIEKCPDEHVDWLKGRLMHGNEISLSTRIKLIIEPFKSHLGNNKERTKLLRKIVDTRNYLTHYSENLKDNAAEGQELWDLCQKMEVIFQLHFLKVIEFNEEEISNVIENSYPLKQKLTNNISK
ncbi:hypothetical protein O8C97_04920 [Aliarcobacter butzleri]|uniref:ApeA N-terminal domain 1-containing protein n=1 Tax=Aliarcobacter butzleri TaxID=28197 RepID=UPI00063AFEFB|nr:HEPN domain-containing protein [Aliarcobacter butzleri]MDN5042268.1 hypothetical protein [Aliarcobacter butzleri]MDN5047179.1 hypothetical protein [Aliarcobacter butzleri]